MKYENMHNVFKIILKLIESFKSEINIDNHNKSINNLNDVFK
jgi:hypothetical protein